MHGGFVQNPSQPIWPASHHPAQKSLIGSLREQNASPKKATESTGSELRHVDCVSLCKSDKNLGVSAPTFVCHWCNATLTLGACCGWWVAPPPSMYQSHACFRRKIQALTLEEEEGIRRQFKKIGQNQGFQARCLHYNQDNVGENWHATQNVDEKIASQAHWMCVCGFRSNS